ncbi:hypothetical protein B0J12DRAFT_116861 [Macrophomina phaseolina]|uniref:Uncharacterized protein n=1 Tax=Macrophomina phaseolina TaxID=35725 RepID=A0ABQ8G924_9PEZI|nr:hypothetical protein B0J12DRAFT_116861 [Macrophomina phaseolina]
MYVLLACPPSVLPCVVSFSAAPHTNTSSGGESSCETQPSAPRPKRLEGMRGQWQAAALRYLCFAVGPRFRCLSPSPPTLHSGNTNRNLQLDEALCCRQLTQCITAARRPSSSQPHSWTRLRTPAPPSTTPTPHQYPPSLHPVSQPSTRKFHLSRNKATNFFPPNLRPIIIIIIISIISQAAPPPFTHPQRQSRPHRAIAIPPAAASQLPQPAIPSQ